MTIVVDDQLMRDTLQATGLKTKRAVVEKALRTLLRVSKQAEIRRFRNQLARQGELQHDEEQQLNLADTPERGIGRANSA